MAGPPEHAGPPSHAGPPDHVREKFKSVNRGEGGEIEVSDYPVDELANNVDWENLSPFEEYVLAVLDREGYLD